MGTQTIQRLTEREFHARYDGIKPYYEFWNGEAVQKNVATLLHNLVQVLLTLMLWEAGSKASSEQELRVDPDWHPIPDVVGMNFNEHPYPTKPVEIVIEILSPEDRLSRVAEKCRKYISSGITRQAFVVDPEHRFGLQWNARTQTFIFVDSFSLSNGNTLELSDLWQRLDQRLES
jgi:Uma2 family endonuclease